MSNQRIKVEYRNAVRGAPILHFSIPSASELTNLIGLFRKLSESPLSVRASELPLFELDNVRDVEFVSVGERKEPARKLQRDKSREFYRWIHALEGWIQCAELAEGLSRPGHQYFDYGENNDVGIEASFTEEHKPGNARPAK